MKRVAPRNEGFSLLELMVAGSVMLITLVALSGVMVLVSHQREQASAKSRVLGQAESLLEEIKGAAPEIVEQTYEGKEYAVTDVPGAGSNAVLRVDVDSVDPTLLGVTVEAAWTVLGNEENLSLETTIYNPQG